MEISNEGVFGDGWRELVKDNGVQEFDFIVFKHHGNMVFDFMVFDQTSCERQYPSVCDEMDVEEAITESDPIYTYSKFSFCLFLGIHYWVLWTSFYLFVMKGKYIDSGGVLFKIYVYVY